MGNGAGKRDSKSQKRPSIAERGGDITRAYEAEFPVRGNLSVDKKEKTGECHRKTKIHQERNQTVHNRETSFFYLSNQTIKRYTAVLYSSDGEIREHSRPEKCGTKTLVFL
jgi:hypothetical protein